MTRALLAGLLGVALGSAARHPTPPPQEPEEDERVERPIRFVQPSAETRKLAALVGRWKLEERWSQPERYKRGAYEGEPGAGGWGTLSVRPGPGGFSVVGEYDVRNPMGRVTALWVAAWDPARSAYVLDEIHSAFPGVLHLTGRFVEGDLVWSGEDARTGPARAVRRVWKGLGLETWTERATAADGRGRQEPVVETTLSRSVEP
jgi:hypothetical protein